jgi:5-formyltetrahydrofolate cyclo-ligase
MVTKDSLRRAIKSRLREQSFEERDKKSLKIQKRLFGMPSFKKARRLLFYVSMPTEVNTFGMIDAALKMKKRVLVPKTDWENKKLGVYEITDRQKDLRKGTLGIWEPRPEKTRAARITEIECVIVPGLVFDKTRRRIGRGAGFYDRFLDRLGTRVPKIGLAFSFQVVERVLCEKHDVAMDAVITD